MRPQQTLETAARLAQSPCGLTPGLVTGQGAGDFQGRKCRAAFFMHPVS